jgi:hypothetical protein
MSILSNTVSQIADHKTTALAVANNQLCAGFPAQSRGSEAIIAGITFTSITLPLILLRCWSRYSIAKELWWDDWTILVSGVCYTRCFNLNLLTHIADLDWDIGNRHNRYVS